MKKVSVAVILGLVFIQPALADSRLQSVPETNNERIYIAVFCDASVKASNALREAAARWIVKNKPDLDCSKEYVPSLVNTQREKK